MTDSPIAALYLRSAVADDGTIADQRERCTRHAITAGWRVREIFVDNGAAGSGSAARRPGLAALHACIGEGRAQVVVATDPARISRDLEALAEHERSLQGNGAQLVYVDTGGGIVEPRCAIRAGTPPQGGAP